MQLRLMILDRISLNNEVCLYSLYLLCFIVSNIKKHPQFLPLEHFNPLHDAFLFIHFFSFIHFISFFITYAFDFVHSSNEIMIIHGRQELQVRNLFAIARNESLNPCKIYLFVCIFICSRVFRVVACYLYSALSTINAKCSMFFTGTSVFLVLSLQGALKFHILGALRKGLQWCCFV